MKDYVSGWWASGLALTLSMSVVGAIFISFGFPWAGLVWAITALGAALWVRFTSPRTITQLVRDIDAEPPSTSSAEPKAICAPTFGPVVTALDRGRTP